MIENCLRQKWSSRTFIIITPVLDESCQSAVDRLRRYADLKPIVLCAKEDEP